MRMTWGRILTLWPLVLALVCGGAASVLSDSFKQRKSGREPFTDDISYLLVDSATAQIVSIGYGTFVSSLLWVDAIFEHVDAELEGKPRNHPAERLSQVILLDPAWEEPYHFAGLTLEDGGGRPSLDAIRIMKSGVERFPRSWKLRVYLGMGFLARGDTVSASSVMAELAHIPGRVPPYIRELAITYAYRKSGRLGAIEDILLGLQVVDDPVERLGFVRKLTMIIDSAGLAGARDTALAIEDAFRTGDVSRQARWGGWLVRVVGATVPESGSSRSP